MINISKKQIYFMKPVGMDGPIKIGCTKFPKDRLRVFTYWSPFPLEIICMVPGDGKVEHVLHRHFAFCHSHKEWFHASPALLDLIDKVKTGTPLGEIVDLSKKVGPHPQWVRNANVSTETVTPTAPLSNLDYIGKIADRVIASRSDGGLNIVHKHEQIAGSAE